MWRVLLGTVLVGLCVACAGSSELTSTPNASLIDFVFAGPDPPESCSVAQKPSLASDREVVSRLAEQTLLSEAAPSPISALFGVYYEGPEYNEIGYFGFDFDSIGSAEQAASLLVQEGEATAQGRFSVFLVGNIVVEVWRDDEGSISCFAALKQFVSAQTEAAGGAEMPLSDLRNNRSQR